MKKSTEKKTPDIKVKVNRAIEFESGDVGFDADVNGITVYNMVYHEGKTKKGYEYSVVNFPQRKGKDDKYYNLVWFPVSDELKADIVKQLEGLI